MRYSDKPISKPSQDILGRAGFSLTLARGIDRLSVAGDGFVIAIVGDWGSGKSSVIELVTRYLRFIEMERASNFPILDDVRAQPCTIRQIEDMSEIFERVEDRVATLEASTLNLNYWQRAQRIDDFRKWIESDEEAEQAQRFWQLKHVTEREPRTVVVRFSPWLIAARAELAGALFSELARALGEKLGDEVRQAFAALLQRLSEFAPVAGVALDLATGAGAGKLLTSGKGWWQNTATRMAAGQTLDELRVRLRSVLRALDDRRVLVVIDDLDRLTPPEALEMVSLVKSLGDLPNVIYLLAYDDLKLARLIKSAIKVDGAGFLDKIVQYPVHLPAIADRDLARLLDADLATVLSDVSARDQSRLGGTWHFIFRYYLRTPRDVRRYINSVSVSIPTLGRHLDLIDLLVLEVLRLYEPDIYWWVRQNLDDLTE